jgi:PilZ domain
MPELHARAQRFTIQTPIRYREVGGKSWFEGRTENISRSGVLFRCEHLLEPKAAVQMSFTLPVSMCDDGPGQIFCRGTVVRTTPTTGANVTAIAAAIRSYRLVRRDRETKDLTGQPRSGTS